MTPKLFSELGLSPEVLKAIDKLGFEQASPIQAATIPALLQGRDVVGQSQTGSGKTAAFAIPAIEKVDPHQKATQVLILCPTRELAVQVSEEVFKLACFKRGIHALPIYGGQSYDRQLQGLRQGAQIVIGTPGRVMDHMNRGTLQLRAVKMVVLDEADVMLNMGFRDDIEFILKAVSTGRQTVFFCATMPRAILDLIQTYARNPEQIRLEQKTMTVPSIEQIYYEVMGRYKLELLTRLIDMHDFRFGIIFCNTKRMVDELTDHLEAQGYSADRLHGDMSQQLRDRVMLRFRRSGLEFLVATDVAARGIDVDDVQVVFNYDLPYDVEDYVHRIGRTGRAGRNGIAISFVSGRELFQIRAIENYIRTRIRRGHPPTASEVQEAREGYFIDTIRTVLQEAKFKPQEHLIELLLEEGFSSTDIASALIHMLREGKRPETDATPPKAAPRPLRPAQPEQPRPMKERPPKPVVPKAAPKTITPAVAPKPADPAPAVQAEIKPVQIEVPKLAPVVVAPKPVVQAPAKPAVPAAPTPPSPTPKPVVEKPATPAPKPVQKPHPKPAPFAPAQPPAPRPPKAPRGPEGHIRLHVNTGIEMGATAENIVQSIMGLTGLPATTVSTVDLRDRYLFVSVASEHANAIISKMNRSQLQGRKIKVKLA